MLWKLYSRTSARDGVHTGASVNLGASAVQSCATSVARAMFYGCLVQTLLVMMTMMVVVVLRNEIGDGKNAIAVYQNKHSNSILSDWCKPSLKANHNL